jgi:hydroxymethylpyrimidine pyrophosphatase-like HAD family hydrolase
MNEEWIGVDLDGTLAAVDYSRPYNYRVIGEPIPRMVERIKAWRKLGTKVKIVTARVSTNLALYERMQCAKLIREWCLEHVGEELDVTSEKDYYMRELWDDRVVQVIQNTGMSLKEYAIAYGFEKLVNIDG